MQPPEPLVIHLPGSLSSWDCFIRIAHLPYVLFLDSATHHSVLGRYSYLTADPFEVVKVNGPAEIRRGMQQVKSQGRQWQTFHFDHLPPFQGGLAGLWGYGVNQALENIPSPRWNDFAVPDLCLGWYDWVIAIDHLEHQSFLISTGLPEQERVLQQNRAEDRAEHVLSWLESKEIPIMPERVVERTCPKSPCYSLPKYEGVFSNFTPEGFREVIQKGIEYTHAGDCFQVNLAQRLMMPFEGNPVELYQNLRNQSPAQCAGYFDMGQYILASSSPERFIQINQFGDIETRPIKGTRPRRTDPEHDQAMAQELVQSAKDRAENVMIVDLLRNDLGRVSEFGSISVPELCKLESNASVHHLVSSVRSRMRRELTPFDVLEATLPGGSVTGAPKVRAMEIIAELEPSARGAYCGCLGFISFSGCMDTNILIRTITLGDGWAQFPVGGGIVADSNAEMEYRETLDKAQGMLSALACTPLLRSVS